MHKCWSLYNKEEKLRIDDLRIDQVRTILLAIPSSRIRDWYACKEGDLHWQAIGEVPEFYEDAMAVKGTSEPAKQDTETAEKPSAPAKAVRRPLFEDAPAGGEFETTLQVESVPTKERRTARRYVRNLEFKVTVPGTNFKCDTLDISMSGVSLKENLPASLPKSFRAELSLSGSVVKIHVNRITDNTLKFVEADAWDVLRQWIVNW